MPRTRTRSSRRAPLAGGLASVLVVGLAAALLGAGAPALAEAGTSSPGAPAPLASAPAAGVRIGTAAGGSRVVAVGRPAAATPTASPSAPPSAPVLRLGVSTTLVRGAGVLTVSGRYLHAAGSPAAGASVDVLGRVPGAAGAVLLGRMTTDATGLASLRLVARVSREYSLRTGAGALTTAPVLVQVQPVLTVALSPRSLVLGRTAVLTGQLTPAYLGARVRVQRRLPSGWTSIATAGTSATGAYRWSATPGLPGRYGLRALLPPSAASLGAASAAADLVVTARTLRLGDRGADVLQLQRRLAGQSLDVGRVDGVFGVDLQHAVTAFQKTQDLPRTGVVDRLTTARLAAPRPVRLRYPARGRAVEVDLTRQVLYLSEAGRLTRVVDVSTGSGRLYVSDGVTSRAYTPLGRYAVQRKVDGIDVGRLGVLYRPAYFVQGWAVHGSAAVPPYPDSHGCVRVTDSAMDRLYRLLQIGVPVSVYRS